MKFEPNNEKFKGYVELPEYLNIAQVRAFEDSLGDLNEGDEAGDKRVWISISDEKRLPVILLCVKEWHIEGVPEKPTLETFPMTPLKDAHDLVDTIFREISKLWMGETVPNA